MAAAFHHRLFVDAETVVVLGSVAEAEAETVVVSESVVSLVVASSLDLIWVVNSWWLAIYKRKY